MIQLYSWYKKLPTTAFIFSFILPRKAEWEVVPNKHNNTRPAAEAGFFLLI